MRVINHTMPSHVTHISLDTFQTNFASIALFPLQCDTFSAHCIIFQLLSHLYSLQVYMCALAVTGVTGQASLTGLLAHVGYTMPRSSSANKAY